VLSHSRYCVALGFFLFRFFFPFQGLKENFAHVRTGGDPEGFSHPKKMKLLI
jgi:hypothetical protein